MVNRCVKHGKLYWNCCEQCKRERAWRDRKQKEEAQRKEEQKPRELEELAKELLKLGGGEVLNDSESKTVAEMVHGQSYDYMDFNPEIGPSGKYIVFKVAEPKGPRARVGDPFHSSWGGGRDLIFFVVGRYGSDPSRFAAVRKTTLYAGGSSSTHHSATGAEVYTDTNFDSRDHYEFVVVPTKSYEKPNQTMVPLTHRRRW